MSTPSRSHPTGSRATRWGAIAALAAAVAFAAQVVVVAVGTGVLSDHSVGIGRITEALAAVAFLAGAVSLGFLSPARGRAWWAPAIVGLAASGITMLVVVASAVEPPLWLFYAEVAVAFVGLVVVAVSAIRRRILPWWAAMGLALMIPIMFFAPANGVFLCVVWLLVGFSAPRMQRRQAEAGRLAMLPS